MVVLRSLSSNTLLLVTKGFKDLLLIGNQQRPDIFSLQVPNKNPLYSSVEEINERVSSKGEPIEPINDLEIDSLIKKIKKNNIESVAISFLHSYLNSDHEKRILQKLKKTRKKATIYFVFFPVFRGFISLILPKAFHILEKFFRGSIQIFD